MAAVDCAVRYTQTGESPGNAYGNSPLSSNGAVLYYRDLDEGTMWGEYDILSAITIYPKAGLTGKSGVIFGSSGSVTTQWYMEITCNNCKIRFPQTGNHTITASNYSGYGKAYNGFTWGYGVYIPISQAAINSGKIALVSGDIKNFLSGVRDLQSIAMQFYFPANSNYRVISNAHAEITSWEKNTPPITPVLNYPFNGAITYNTKPKISMTGTDVDGDKLTYQYSTDGSNWYNLATDVSSETPIAGQISALQSLGAKTLHIRTYDGIDYSSVYSINLAIEDTNFQAAQSEKINSATITNTQNYITNLAAYYNNQLPQWTPCETGTKIKLEQLEELITALGSVNFTIPSIKSKISRDTFITNIDQVIKDS